MQHALRAIKLGGSAHLSTNNAPPNTTICKLGITCSVSPHQTEDRSVCLIVRQGVVAPDGAEVDHIELFGPPSSARADSKNFVLCPGRVYDRSPCGTGTSAKIACLIADGQLRPGGIWRQEGIVGSIFEAKGRIEGPQVVCIVKGSAHITAEATLICGEADPFRTGIRA